MDIKVGGGVTFQMSCTCLPVHYTSHVHRSLHFTMANQLRNPTSAGTKATPKEIRCHLLNEIFTLVHRALLLIIRHFILLLLHHYHLMSIWCLSFCFCCCCCYNKFTYNYLVSNFRKTELTSCDCGFRGWSRSSVVWARWLYLGPCLSLNLSPGTPPLGLCMCFCSGMGNEQIKLRLFAISVSQCAKKCLRWMLVVLVGGK